jgi:hypothetical protein
MGPRGAHSYDSDLLGPRAVWLMQLFRTLVRQTTDSLGTKLAGARDLDMPGDCFCFKVGRLPTLHNGVHDIRRQESQADQTTHIAHGEAPRMQRSQQASSPGGSDANRTINYT